MKQDLIEYKKLNNKDKSINLFQIKDTTELSRRKSNYTFSILVCLSLVILIVIFLLYKN